MRIQLGSGVVEEIQQRVSALKNHHRIIDATPMHQLTLCIDAGPDFMTQHGAAVVWNGELAWAKYHDVGVNPDGPIIGRCEALAEQAEACDIGEWQ